MWGLSSAMVSSWHNKPHSPKMEINSPKSECGCLYGGVIENCRICNPLTEVPTPNSLLSTVYTVRQYFSTFLSILCVSWLTTKSRLHTVHRAYFADTFDATMQGYSLVYPSRKCCSRFTAGLRFTFRDEASSVPLFNCEAPRFRFDTSSILANFVNCGVHSVCSDWFISVMCSTTNAMIGCFVGDTRKVTKNTWANVKKKALQIGTAPYNLTTFVAVLFFSKTYFCHFAGT